MDLRIQGDHARLDVLDHDELPHRQVARQAVRNAACRPATSAWPGRPCRGACACGCACAGRVLGASAHIGWPRSSGASCRTRRRAGARGRRSAICASSACMEIVAALARQFDQHHAAHVHGRAGRFQVKERGIESGERRQRFTHPPGQYAVSAPLEHRLAAFREGQHGLAMSSVLHHGRQRGHQCFQRGAVAGLRAGQAGRGQRRLHAQRRGGRDLFGDLTATSNCWPGATSCCTKPMRYASVPSNSSPVRSSAGHCPSRSRPSGEPSPRRRGKTRAALPVGRSAHRWRPPGYRRRASAPPRR